MEGKERPKKEAQHSRVVGRSCNTWGRGGHIKLVLGGCKTNRSPHSLTKCEKFIKRSSLGLVTYTVQRLLTTHCFFRAVTLKTALAVGMNNGKNVCSKEKRRR